MDLEALKAQWLREERDAHIRGWDFSHIEGRYEEGEDIPWDYEAVVRSYLSPELRLLDMDTGGGEFLLGLGHPGENTSATEGYPPNVALCRSVLPPHGIDFREAADVRRLPFGDGAFDIVINRHGNFDAGELARVLRPGGVFVTQQVGAENDRGLVELLLPGTRPPYPEQYLEKACRKFEDAGFEILQAREAFPSIRFYSVGALVWFARVIPWEFPGFSVERCWAGLCRAQELLEQEGVIEASTHRFLLAASRTAQRKGGAGDRC